MGDMFPSITTAQSGMGVYKAWIDATSDNVANINTARRTNQPAYQARHIIAQSASAADGVTGAGARVAAVQFGDPNGRNVYDPTNPLADNQGMVKMPDINLSDEMTHLIIAQRAYQANVTAFERARDGYLRELEIGK
jgi:flagellar basal-body rod protein FlgC